MNCSKESAGASSRRSPRARRRGRRHAEQDEPGERDSEDLYERGLDDARAEDLAAQLAAVERAEAAARGRHLRALGAERRADPRRAARSGAHRRADGRGAARRSAPSQASSSPAADRQHASRRPPRARSARPRRRRGRAAARGARAPRPGGSRAAAPDAAQPWRTRCTASGPAAEPVAGSSRHAEPGREHARLERRRAAGEAAHAPAPGQRLPPRAGRDRGRRPRSGRAAARGSGAGRCCSARPGSPSRSTPSAASSGPGSRDRLPASGSAGASRPRARARRGLGARPRPARTRLERRRGPRPARREQRARAEHRVAREGQLGGGREDPHARVAALPRRAAGRPSPRGFSSRAIACIVVALVRPRPSANTASWLPSSGALGEHVEQDVAERCPAASAGGQAARARGASIGPAHRRSDRLEGRARSRGPDLDPLAPVAHARPAPRRRSRRRPRPRPPAATKRTSRAVERQQRRRPRRSTSHAQHLAPARGDRRGIGDRDGDARSACPGAPLPIRPSTPALPSASVP